jgi:hypothetical protein
MESILVKPLPSLKTSRKEYVMLDVIAHVRLDFD